MDRLDGIDWHPHGWRSPRSFRQSNRTKKKILVIIMIMIIITVKEKKRGKIFLFLFCFFYFSTFLDVWRGREKTLTNAIVHSIWILWPVIDYSAIPESHVSEMRRKQKNNNKGGAWGGEGEIPSPEANYERKKEREIIPHSRSLTARNHLIVSINGRNGMMGRI